MADGQAAEFALVERGGLALEIHTIRAGMPAEDGALEEEGAAIKAAVLLVGTAFSAWCAWRGGGNWAACLPAVSFLFCSCGTYLTRSSSAMRRHRATSGRSWLCGFV